jgi:two-component system chemotaxis response regulator CheB
VREAVSGKALGPGRAWLAPGDHHLVLARDDNAVRLRTHQGPPVHSCRPSVDVLLTSAAEVYGAGVLAVVLAGTDRDGPGGCEAVRAAGGQVVVQGQPGLAPRVGRADEVLPLERIGAEILRRVRRSRARSAVGVRLA